MVASLPCPPSGHRAAPTDTARAAVLAQLIALATRVPVEEIVSRERASSRAVQARYICLYMANVVYQWPLHRVGSIFGRDRTTVGLACRRVEDSRDDPRVDASLTAIEAALKAVPVEALPLGLPPGPGS